MVEAASSASDKKKTDKNEKVWVEEVYKSWKLKLFSVF